MRTHSSNRVHADGCLNHRYAGWAFPPPPVPFPPDSPLGQAFQPQHVMVIVSSTCYKTSVHLCWTLHSPKFALCEHVNGLLQASQVMSKSQLLLCMQIGCWLSSGLRHEACLHFMPAPILLLHRKSVAFCEYLLNQRACLTSALRYS